MSEQFHIVVKIKSPDHSEEEPDFDYQVICPNPGEKCGFSECMEEHTVDGKNVHPYDHDEGDPWAGCEDWEFHGVPHTYQPGFGWTIPYTRCAVRDHDALRDEANDLLWDKPEGSYPVIDNWDEYLMYLELAPTEAPV
jgi:hypothetical protein